MGNKMNKSLGEDVSDKVREAKDAVVKKVTETVEKIKQNIEKKLESKQRTTDAGAVRG
jgi:hypothetical protein